MTAVFWGRTKRISPTLAWPARPAQVGSSSLVPVLIVVALRGSSEVRLWHEADDLEVRSTVALQDSRDQASIAEQSRFMSKRASHLRLDLARNI